MLRDKDATREYGVRLSITKHAGMSIELLLQKALDDYITQGVITGYKIKGIVLDD